MIINTAEISPGAARPRPQFVHALLWLCLALLTAGANAGPAPGPWIPIFKGVDLAYGTNTPGVPGNFAELQAVRCVRVDLTDPDIKLMSTPVADNYIPESSETYTRTVPDFLQLNNLQIACDANYYSAHPGGSDPGGEGIPCEVFGLQISTGVVVSAQTSSDATIDPRYASILFTTNNRAQMVFVNRPPGTNTAGIWTAVTGYYPVVSNGVNIGNAASTSYPDSFIHQSQPRTAYGLSQNGRYLFLMTIDGRQPGYSDGAFDSETAYWLIQFGAWNGINMDGGGSTAMYMADSTGSPVALNHSSYMAAYGHERYVGSHFGLSAKPLPGFINDVSALPDDTAATISWTTTNAATSLVEYGLTPSLGSSSAYSADMRTNHAVLLPGLVPGSDYYFQVVSSDGVNQYSSGLFSFTTTNYASSTLLFDLTNVWAYETANLDGVNWTAPTYDDTAWAGSGPGLLWFDTRGANPNIPVPLLTLMPGNSGTGNPYITYYFRTHFNFTNDTKGAVLSVTDYIDDGAVFYLNGAEISRLRMPDAPNAILNSTLATGYACSNSVNYGDAVCSDTWNVSSETLTNLKTGDNVLAVEVHNYNAASPDITFGLALGYALPYSPAPQLNIQQTESKTIVSWTRGGFTLQQAASPEGPWTNVPGPVVSGPYILDTSAAVQYFRLMK